MVWPIRVFRRGGKDGVGRAALEYADFDELLKMRFAKKEGWLARKNRVDYYIPFLPIQPAQVRAQVALQIAGYKQRLRHCVGHCLRASQSYNHHAPNGVLQRRADAHRMLSMTFDHHF